ncbi:MAG: sigma-70 family RNA polymerase sigma factor [Rhodospirillales bacterium]|jgi:RNA polymerase sigma-70 factor (ECF subfamily)|nr:RNA polymerase subunit sigma-24 [Rhodospirillaceae bacterium]MDP6428279.1 sigma-70 family RNA polymerase sigma factor [Rhodospirillales bacterium]MDP6646144.1 sigma-70 family RNA polymerase sigma factor [Rhodospirillales bacterium]MDP6840693.1 sigma-70 family RNA polymerase sigma factor [Rhodospirillales bacterium]|tara:strand:+ start:237 stop:746 length:510 start_codon:yes stop_codon:yes gene_type:complete
MDKRAALTETLPHVMRYARALTRNADTAEDLLHDCVGRALSRLHLFEAGTNMRAWLFTIMHNIHRQNLRQSSRRPRTDSLTDELAERIGREADQNDKLMLRDFERALGELPDDQRHVILLVGLEDMSYQETADVLEIPVGTVMSRLARARAKLRQAMDGNGKPNLRSVK